LRCSTVSKLSCIPIVDVEADFAAFCSKPVSPEDIALAILDVTKDDCGTRPTQPPGHV